MDTILPIVISSVVTAFITIYTIRTPKKDDINNRMFKELFSPLHRFLKDVFGKDTFSIDEIECYCYKIEHILDDNYDLVPKDLYYWFDMVKSYLKQCKMDELDVAFRKLLEFIDDNYNLLKQKLCYPNNGKRKIRQYIKRTKLWQSLKSFISLIDIKIVILIFIEVLIWSVFFYIFVFLR